VQSHEHHSRVNAWWPGRALAICPITELGFQRVVCALGYKMKDPAPCSPNFSATKRPPSSLVIATRWTAQPSPLGARPLTI